MIYGFVGMGLMGGSLAKAIRKYVVVNTDAIYGFDISKVVLEDAMLDGTIDAMFYPKKQDSSVDANDYPVKKMLAKCDIVFVCLYPSASLHFIVKYQNYFKSGAIVTDISGVKTKLCEGLENDFKRSDVSVIPAHPMAGSEREGYTHSSSEMFKGRNYIFVPLQHTNKNKITILKEIARNIGFTHIIETTAKIHDHKIAFTSQLCHVIAASLVCSAEDTSITKFGGGSFEDLTRIAMINVPLWTELFTADKATLVQHIENFEESLRTIKTAIEKEDIHDMSTILESVRKKRIEMAMH
ncbi:MAG TPA: prephenate dehydrogenase [Treponemataceae bacterium]|nr:prephenate dehydrogenase [Treponemataceae bacterium]